MNKIEIEDLCQIIALALEVEKSEISPSASSDTIDDWDSLGHILILTALRDHFGGDYQESPEIASATSVGEIFSILNEG